MYAYGSTNQPTLTPEQMREMWSVMNPGGDYVQLTPESLQQLQNSLRFGAQAAPQTGGATGGASGGQPFDYGTLGNMAPDQAAALLQQQYAAGNLSPMGAAPLTGMPGYSGGPTGEGDWGTPMTPGQGQWLTPDGTYNGQEGAYIGRFDNGQLQNVYFDPKESYGFMDQWGGPLAIAGAALGGGMLASGGFGAGAATDIGVNSAIAGGMEAPLAGTAGAGATAASGGILGGFGGAGSALGGIGGALGSQGGLAALGALAGGVSAAGAPDSETTTATRSTDPRVDSLIFNDMYPALRQQMTQGPSSGLQSAFQNANDYMGGRGGNLVWQAGDAIINQLNGNRSAPTMQSAQIGDTPQAKAAQINMSALPGVSAGTATAGSMSAADLRNPVQQSMDVRPGFDDHIFGDAARNPYLTGALQRGADQARTSYGNLLQDMGQNFGENVLGNIRGGAIASGQYGGSRQGIAEGIAGRAYAQQAGRAAQGLGQDLNSAIIGAQSGSFQQGRQLGAGLLGQLSGQQYGQEQYRAGLAQDAARANAQMATQASIANAGLQTQAGIANSGQMAGLLGQQAGLDQQASLYNTGLLNQTNQANAGFQQAANTNNLQSQLGTQGLNAQTQNQGIGNAWNQYSGMANLANSGSNYDLNRLITGMGAFAPYAQMYGQTQQTSPLYNNPLASTLGGGIAGAQLGRNLFGA